MKSRTSLPIGSVASLSFILALGLASCGGELDQGDDQNESRGMSAAPGKCYSSTWKTEVPLNACIQRPATCTWHKCTRPGDPVNDWTDDVDKSTCASIAQANPTCKISFPPPGRWVKVDLTSQRAFAMETDAAGKETVVRTFLVSTGAPAPNTYTNAGTYTILARKENYTMRSPHPKGSALYYPDSPVRWWQKIDSMGKAFHTAPWRDRSAFGKIPMSHGCINLMDEVVHKSKDAQALYNWTTVGMRVLIVGRTPRADGTCCSSFGN